MKGLTDLLDGDASFADVIHRDAGSRLHFVPFGSKEEFNPDDLDMPRCAGADLRFRGARGAGSAATR